LLRDRANCVGTTPLAIAALQGHGDVVSRLLGAGARLPPDNIHDPHCVYSSASAVALLLQAHRDTLVPVVRKLLADALRQRRGETIPAVLHDIIADYAVCGDLAAMTPPADDSYRGVALTHSFVYHGVKAQNKATCARLRQGLPGYSLFSISTASNMLHSGAAR
jgi:hypothetical protein